MADVFDRMRVLLHTPTSAAAETVAGVTRHGGQVFVRPSDLTPALDDLRLRGLVQVTDDEVGLADAVDAFDVVMRCPQPEAATLPDRTRKVGTVTLVGGGPTTRDLLTVAGLEALRRADVVVTDRLAPLDALESLAPTAQVIHAGKIPRGEFTPQETINATLIEHAKGGRNVVRLKGGDNFVFGRGGEEWNACIDAGVPVQVVPGVTSSVAVPALAGIPLTHRSLSQGFVVVSAHVAPDDGRSTINWPALAASGLTLVVLMGVETLPKLARALTDGGLSGETPAATISNGGMPSQQIVRAPLSDLPGAVASAGLKPPAITVIGDVVDALEHPDGL